MKVLCILWDLCGIYAFFKMFANSKGDIPIILGALIGIILICGLPTYFCFREKKENRYERPQYRPATQRPVQKAATCEPSTGLVSKKFRNETYYKRLKRLCNPANFVDNYDKETIDTANQIYSKALSISSDDKESILQLIAKAESELELNFLDEGDYNSLLRNLNPKNYMEPYDSDRVTLANDLYSSISQPGINLTTFLKIKEQAKPLRDYLEQIEQQKREQYRKKQDKERQRQQEEEKYFFIFFVLLAVILIIVTAFVNIFLK